MSISSTASRVFAFSMTLVFAFAPTLAQDISGGAGVLLASADVEAKLGKGIFTPAQNRPHAAKRLGRNTATDAVLSAHTSRSTTGGSNRQSSGPRPTSTAKPADTLSGPPLGG